MLEVLGVHVRLMVMGRLSTVASGQLSNSIGLGAVFFSNQLSCV
jgi:hypothetical protein